MKNFMKKFINDAIEQFKGFSTTVKFVVSVFLIGSIGFLLLIVVAFFAVIFESEEKTVERAERIEQRKEEEQKDKEKKSEAKEEQKDKEKKSEDKEEKETDNKPKEENKSPEQEIKEAMDNIAFLDLLSVKGDFEEPIVMQAEFLGKDNLTKNMTISSMKSGIRDAVYALKEPGYEVENIGISVKLPLIDEYGNAEEQYVIKSDFGKETINKLADDKYMIDTDKLNIIADSWWEHSAIRN